MSPLLNLVNKAKSFLAGRPKPVVRSATDAIKHDRFLAAQWQDVLDDMPPVTDLINELDKTHDYAADLVRDVGLSFWQVDPALREAAEMDPTRLGNHAVVAALQSVPEYKELRQHTVLDKYSSGMAAVGVTEQIQQLLAENEALAEAGKQAAEAQEQAEAAGNACADAVAQTAEAEAARDQVQQDADALKPEGQGPLTEEAQAAQDAADAAATLAEQAAAMLEALLAAAEAATQQSIAANENAAAAAATAQQQLRRPVREAVQEANTKLADEADLFASWGVGDSDLKKMSYAERVALAHALRNNRIAAFRKLLGRFRQMHVGLQAERVEFDRSEVYDTELSGDLSRIVGSELALLHTPRRLLRLNQMAKFNEGTLLSKKYRGTEKVGHGAVVCCVDNSSSMAGPQEAFAKAFALALLDQAQRSKRDFVGINFASPHQQHVYRFPASRSVDIKEVLGFIEDFFDGGTDFMRPLDLATDILESEFNGAGKVKGDIVFITDDECEVSMPWMAEYQARKKRLGFRTFGVAMGCSVGGTLESFSDNTRSITDFTDPDTVRDIFKVIA